MTFYGWPPDFVGWPGSSYVEPQWHYATPQAPTSITITTTHTCHGDGECGDLRCPGLAHSYITSSPLNLAPPSHEERIAALEAEIQRLRKLAGEDSP
jgi:hypothetical protein